jgi:predicted enzyme related to lactoylglutathione lyase
MLGKLRTVIYHVNDLAKAKLWYTAITGFQPYFDEPFYVGFDINGCELGLDPDLSMTKPGNTSVAYWSVTGIQSVADRLVQEGGRLVDPVHNVGGEIFVATVEDPFGNAIGLIEGAKKFFKNNAALSAN